MLRLWLNDNAYSIGQWFEVYKTKQVSPDRKTDAKNIKQKYSCSIFSLIFTTELLDFLYQKHLITGPCNVAWWNCTSCLSGKEHIMCHHSSGWLSTIIFVWSTMHITAHVACALLYLQCAELLAWECLFSLTKRSQILISYLSIYSFHVPMNS